MEIKLSGREDVIVTEELKKKIEDKFLPHIEKLLVKFPEDTKVGYVNFVQPNHYTYQVNFDLQLPHAHIYADAKAENWTQAIVSLRHKVQKEIKSSNTQLNNKHFKSMAEVVAPLDREADEADEYSEYA